MILPLTRPRLIYTNKFPPHYPIGHRQWENDIHSFIYSRYFYSASLIHYYSEALPITVESIQPIESVSEFRRRSRGVHPPEPMKHSSSVSEKRVSKSQRKIFPNAFSRKNIPLCPPKFLMTFFSHRPLFSNISLPRLYISYLPFISLYFPISPRSCVQFPLFFQFPSLFLRYFYTTVSSPPTKMYISFPIN